MGVGKRDSLMRVGKRDSLMKVGNRDSLMGVGKRDSLKRVGKRTLFALFGTVCHSAPVIMIKKVKLSEYSW